MVNIENKTISICYIFNFISTSRISLHVKMSLLEDVETDSIYKTIQIELFTMNF